MEKETRQNDRCAVRYDPEINQIYGRDLTDHYNEPAFYSKGKRGVRAAWDEIKAEFNDETRMHDVIALLQRNGIRTHYWCMVD